VTDPKVNLTECNPIGAKLRRVERVTWAADAAVRRIAASISGGN